MHRFVVCEYSEAGGVDVEGGGAAGVAEWVVLPGGGGTL